MRREHPLHQLSFESILCADESSLMTGATRIGLAAGSGSAQDPRLGCSLLHKRERTMADVSTEGAQPRWLANVTLGSVSP